MIPPCLTLSNIRYESRVKWSNPGKGIAPYATPRCSSYWEGSLLVTLDYDCQFIYIYIYIYIIQLIPYWSSKLPWFLLNYFYFIRWMYSIYLSYIRTYIYIYIYIYIYCGIIQWLTFIKQHCFQQSLHQMMTLGLGMFFWLKHHYH